MSRRWGLVLACLLALAASAAPPAATAANGIVVTSTAVYDVRPEDGVAVVTVDVAATNVTPETATQIFYYDAISLPIPARASSVTATSGGAFLGVSLEPADDVAQLANVAFGTNLFYQQTFRFTLSFVMTDAGGDPGRETWIRSRFVAFPVWGYGTPEAAGASVEVVMPPGFEVLIPYGEMEILEGADATRIVAIGIDPGTFTAYVSAERGGERARSDIEVEMADGPVAVRFHAWPDDPEWTQRQSDFLRRGLPVLEREIGIPYPIDGTLNVSEHAYQHLGAYAGFFIGGVDSIEMRFDADAFTALHEAAHVWFNDHLAEERWLLEGFASYYAEVAGRQLDADLEMFQLTDELREVAFPLVEWDAVGTEDPEHEEYGYAASHAVAREIAELAGPEVLRVVWQQADEEELAYGRNPAEDGPRRVPNPDDWRRILDLFENASDRDFDPVWDEWLLNGRQADDLGERHEARKAYEATEAALGSWSMPASTRRHMEAWDFHDATSELARLEGLVRDHAAMVARAEALSLEPSAEVGDRLGTDGIDGAVDELGRQADALELIETAAARVADEPQLIETIGLLFDADPDAELDAARTAFEAGDEDGAGDRAETATALANGAAESGRLRVAIAGGGVLAADALVLALLLVARRRRHRLAAPNG